MNATRTWIAVALLAVAAFGFNQYAAHLESQRSSQLGGSPVVRLFSSEQLEGLRFAAVSLRVDGSDTEYLYVRSKGRWRCQTAYGAPLVRERMEDFLNRLLNSRGVLRSTAATPNSTYGFDPPRTVISLHGPKVLEAEDRDLLATLELGYSLGDRWNSASTGPTVDESSGGPTQTAEEQTEIKTLASVTFARLTQSSSALEALGLGVTNEVLELNFDPRASLLRLPGSNMPPMLDQRMLPGPWPGEDDAGFRVLQVQTALHEYRLVRQDRPAAEVAPGEAPWSWVMEQGEGFRMSAPASYQRVETFCAFLRIAPSIGLEDPKRYQEFGFDRPLARVSGLNADGSELDLRLGDRAPRANGLFCLNIGSSILCVVSDSVSKALTPDPRVFLDETLPDPWQDFIGK